MFVCGYIYMFMYVCVCVYMCISLYDYVDGSDAHG